MYSSLRVVTPPATEPVSLVEMKAQLRITQDVDDALIGGMITAARWWAESYLGRALMLQTLLWTMSQDPPTGALPLLPMPLLVLPVIMTAPQVMNKPLELPRSPVQSIVSVTETDTDGTTHTLTAGDWIADLTLDPARLRLNWITVPRFLQHIQVTFTAGYVAPDQIPVPILLAIKLMVSWLYEHRGDVAEAAADPPKAMEYLLAPYRIAFFGGG
jgi:hypothetical protein